MSTFYRYPGVKPFEATESALFFGRDHDRRDLANLLNREQLAVLFGKSGYGKSSLLKAGLIPDLKAQTNAYLNPNTGEEQITHNCPIYVRFNLYGKSGVTLMPCDKTIACLQEQLGSSGTDPEIQNFLAKEHLDQSLWAVFKANKVVAEQRVFLIFDQFEEFFSYPSEAQAQFGRQLSELLYTHIPQAVRDAMEGLSRGLKNKLHRPLDIHALFSIRSDRLHLLNGMRVELPAILHTRYELKALTELQAAEAIVQPARLADPRFLLPQPFEYEPAALQKILMELNKATADETDLEPRSQIEAFQLQMVCQTIEQNLVRRTKKAKGQQPLIVKESDLPNFDQIYEQYYTNKLADLPDKASQQTAHTLLEEEMIIGEDINEVRRISMDKDLLRETMHQNHQLDVSQLLLDYLEDKFLIRRETISGRVHYEVSHDVLLGPMLKSREEARRQIAEKQMRQQQEDAEARAAKAEAEALAERERRLDAERRRRRARLLAAVAIFASLLATGLGIWALDQKETAEAERAKAVELYQKLQKAEEQRLETEKKAQKETFWRTISDMEIILQSPDGCPDRGQLQGLDTLPLNYPEDTVLQTKVETLRKQIQRKGCVLE